MNRANFLFVSNLIALILSTVAPAATRQVLTLPALKGKVCAHEISRDWCRSRVDGIDRQLNMAFREAIGVAPDKEALRLGQRQWLVEVRDRTNALAAAEAAYVARVLELQNVAVRALGKREKPMKEAEQREICEGIARMASTGKLADMLIAPAKLPDARLTEAAALQAGEFVSRYYLGDPSKLFSLQIREDHEFTFAEIFTGGTCDSSEIQPAAPPMSRPGESWPSPEIDPGEQDDVIRWATWGGGESLLVFAGRYFFVTTTSPRNVPGVVTWITPAGTRRPICTLEVQRTERIVDFLRTDAKLCSAAIDGPRGAIHWSGKSNGDFAWSDDERQYLLGHGLRASGMPAVQVATTDIDNDGKPELIGRAQYDSSAGCGGSSSQLMLLTENGEHLNRGAMNDALMGLSTIDSDPVEVFSYDQQQFVRAALDEVPAVFRVTSDAILTECTFHDQPIMRVKTLYPLDGAVRDPKNAASR